MAVPRGVLVLIGCTMMASASCMADIFQDAVDGALASEQATGRQAFDIPAQALMTALRQYSEQTGISVLFDDDLVRHLASPGVHGDYQPQEALRRLLADTGLTAHYASPMAFTLMLADEDDPSSMPVPAKVEAETPEHFAGRLQSSLVRALCRDDVTHPGRYRLVMELWLDASGTVTRTHLLGSTGTPARDQRIEALAATLRLGEVSAGLAQPVTILLSQRPASRPFDCGPYKAG